MFQNTYSVYSHQTDFPWKWTLCGQNNLARTAKGKKKQNKEQYAAEPAQSIISRFPNHEAGASGNYQRMT